MKGKNINTFIPFQFIEFTEDDPYFTQEENTSIPYIANFRDGAIADYRSFHFEGTEQGISITCRGEGNGVLEITGIGDSRKYAEIFINSAKSWETFSSDWKGTAGFYGIRIKYSGDGYLDLLKFQIR